MENTTEENSAASGGDGSRSSLKTNHDAMGMRETRSTLRSGREAGASTMAGCPATLNPQQCQVEQVSGKGRGVFGTANFALCQVIVDQISNMRNSITDDHRD